jgi:hypothetical protein
MVVGSIALGLSLAGCSGNPGGSTTGVDTASESKVEDLPGTDVKQVTLTEHAAQRLGIKTVTISESMPLVAATGPPATPVTSVPFSAVLYAPDGGTWVYTVPQPFTYVRAKVAVVVVRGAKGDEAVLSQAPPTGMMIVSTGVVELYGTELGIGNVT